MHTNINIHAPHHPSIMLAVQETQDCPFTQVLIQLMLYPAMSHRAPGIPAALHHHSPSQVSSSGACSPL